MSTQRDLADSMLGRNISAEHAKIYKEIETKIFTAEQKRSKPRLKRKKKGEVLKKCGRGLGASNKYGHSHKGERWIPIREFALAVKTGTKLQGACRQCDKDYRGLKGRSGANRKKFSGKTKAQIYQMYKANYKSAKGEKKCSRDDYCLHARGPLLRAEEFEISKGMESGLHNHCKVCVKGYRTGTVGDRFIDFMPDGSVIKRTVPKGGVVNCVRYDSAICKGNLHDDHIWPLAVGGSDHQENHQWLCATHNQAKSSSADVSFTSIAKIKKTMMSDRFQQILIEAKRKKTTVSVFHQEMRAVMAKDRISRSKMSLGQLKKLYGDWKTKNNRKHDVDRAARKMKEFSL